MPSVERPQPSVIVGVDGSSDGRRALHWAAAHAGRNRQPLRVLHALDAPTRWPARWTGSEPSETQVAEGRRLVESALADVERTWPAVAVDGVWSVGIAWEVLAREAAPADLLVVGSRGLGRIRSVLLGSVSAEVAQQASCPVVVVRATRDVRYPDTHRGVVVGVDGSDPAVAASEFGFTTAAMRGLPVTVVHAVWDPDGLPSAASPSHLDRLAGDAQSGLDAETIGGWRIKHPDVAVVIRYEYGRPAQVLADVSIGSDLLVVGDRGQGETTALLGSVSRDVIRRARCPVAVIRGRPR
jgi:nucleotide-binding universal stress UspA family protein